jgi:hypothetical protein
MWTQSFVNNYILEFILYTFCFDGEGEKGQLLTYCNVSYFGSSLAVQ